MRTTRGSDRPKGKWWSKTRGLEPAVYESYRSTLVAERSHPTRILAWASTPDGVVIGSQATLSIGAGSIGAGTEWRHLDWHEIEKGGWDSESGQLTWIEYGGKRGSVILTAPARVPELFRERVSASVVMEKFVPVRGKQGIIFSGRRDLSDPTLPILWHATLGSGLTWETEGVQQAADLVMAELRTEYDTA